MATGKAILNALRQELNLNDYRKKHWEGSFDEYLDIVRAQVPNCGVSQPIVVRGKPPFEHALPVQ